MGPTRHLVLGRQIIEFPDEATALEGSLDELVEQGRMLQQAWSLDVLGDTVAVSDRLAGRVHVFTLAGEHLRTLGGPESGGTGPDVLSNPSTVQFSADGSLWVDDWDLGLALRYAPDLQTVEGVRMPDSHWGASGPSIAVDPVLGLVTGSETPGYLLTAYGEEVVDIPSEVPIPENLMDPGLASAGTGGIVLVDGQRLNLWRARLAYDPPRIVAMEEIPIPSWFLRQLRNFMENRPFALGRMQPFNGIRVTPDGVWLEPGAGAGMDIMGILCRSGTARARLPCCGTLTRPTRACGGASH